MRGFDTIIAQNRQTQPQYYLLFFSYSLKILVLVFLLVCVCTVLIVLNAHFLKKMHVAVHDLVCDPI